MKSVKSIIYRYLTDADFFNIYKPPGTEARGGGQTYIDFPTATVSLKQWRRFFSGTDGLQQAKGTVGPTWALPIHSIGIDVESQLVKIYQRRPQSVCIAAQRIHGAGQNRIRAWRPENDFPRPADPNNRHQLPPGLAIYLVRSYDNQVWAGWLLNAKGFPPPYLTDSARDLLGDFLNDSSPGTAGFMSFTDNQLYLEEMDTDSPFLTGAAAATEEAAVAKTEAAVVTAEAAVEELQGQGTPRPSRRDPRHSSSRRQRSESEIVDSLFGEDEEYENDVSTEVREVTTRVRKRNARAVKDLKELYQHRCQITGDEYAFRKQDGTYYTEAHHLLPLGFGGADDPRNIIIVSPLIHRMLHFAEVSEIDLAQIEEAADGSAVLEITVNGEPYRITWHARHAEKVRASEKKRG